MMNGSLPEGLGLIKCNLDIAAEKQLLFPQRSQKKKKHHPPQPQLSPTNLWKTLEIPRIKKHVENHWKTS